MATRPAHAEQSESQRRIARNLDLASDTVIAYSGTKPPPLGNITVEGLIEDLGRVNGAKKAIEKTEKVLKERLKAMVGTPTFTRRADNYEVSLTEQPRYALNQEKAKEVLTELGRLEECMSDSLVPTLRVKEL